MRLLNGITNSLSKLRNRIKSEDAVSWEGIGVPKERRDGECPVRAGCAPLCFYVADARDAGKTAGCPEYLLVGDRERTSGEMNDGCMTIARRRSVLPGG